MDERVLRRVLTPQFPLQPSLGWKSRQFSGFSRRESSQIRCTKDSLGLLLKAFMGKKSIILLSQRLRDCGLIDGDLRE